MIVHSNTDPWVIARSAIAAVDATILVTTRKKVNLVDDAADAISPLNLTEKVAWAIMELRASFSTGAATATTPIYAAREGENTVRIIGSIAWTAGTQTDEAGRFFAKAGVITSYWPTAITGNSAEEANGIATPEIRTRGYSSFYIGVSVLSAGNVTIEAAGYTDAL